MKKVLPSSNGISLHFQVASLFLTLVMIISLVLLQVKKFCAADTPPHISSVTPKSLQHGAVATPTKVTVGLTITDFPSFDVARNDFEFSGIIWFSFDPALVNLKTIEKFSFVKGEIKYISEPSTQLEDDRLTVRYRIRVSFKTNLYYGYFPFEDHTLYLMLSNASVNPDEVIFESTYANVIMDNPYVNGWDYKDHQVTTGFSTVPLGIGQKGKEVVYPSVLFTFEFYHHSIRYLMSILLPLLIIFLIDLFSLCFDQRKERDILVTMTTANIAALVAYRFVLESLTPKVGYPTIADYFFFLFLSNTFMIFMINCVGPYLTRRQKKIISIVVQVFVVLTIALLLRTWLPC